jgi:hypothetical protein
LELLVLYCLEPPAFIQFRLSDSSALPMTTQMTNDPALLLMQAPASFGMQPDT